MIRVKKIAHASYEVPDVEKQTDYYTNILGMTLVAKEKDATFLAEYGGSSLRRAAQGRERAMRARRISDRRRRRSRCLREAGAGPRRQDGAQEGSRTVDRRMLTFEDTKGTVMEVFKRANFSHQKFQANGIVPHKLGHVAFHVTDVKHATKFYCDVLGFRESDWMGDFFSFLRCGPDHHTINLMQTGSNRHFHTAFELRDWGHMQTACDFLIHQRLQAVVGSRPARHRP